MNKLKWINQVDISSGYIIEVCFISMIYLIYLIVFRSKLAPCHATPVMLIDLIKQNASLSFDRSRSPDKSINFIKQIDEFECPYNGQTVLARRLRSFTVARYYTLIKVISDIIDAADGQQVTLLGLLDMSAAFDTVEHDILLHRLETSCGVRR